MAALLPTHMCWWKHGLPKTGGCFETKERPYLHVCVCVGELIPILWKDIRFT